jgi:hypothetical protein
MGKNAALICDRSNAVDLQVDMRVDLVHAAPHNRGVCRQASVNDR